MKYRINRQEFVEHFNVKSGFKFAEIATLKLTKDSDMRLAKMIAKYAVYGGSNDR